MWSEGDMKPAYSSVKIPQAQDVFSSCEKCTKETSFREQ